MAVQVHVTATAAVSNVTRVSTGPKKDSVILQFWVESIFRVLMQLISLFQGCGKYCLHQWNMYELCLDGISNQDCLCWFWKDSYWRGITPILSALTKAQYRLEASSIVLRFKGLNGRINLESTLERTEIFNWLRRKSFQIVRWQMIRRGFAKSRMFFKNGFWRYLEQWSYSQESLKG